MSVNVRLSMDFSRYDSEMDDLFVESTPFWKDKIYYPIYRLFRWHLNPYQWYLRIKWFIQRGRRGYADCDVWSLSEYAATILSNGLRELSKNSIGWPGDETWPTYEGWAEDLESVADGLDHFVAAVRLEETCSCCGQFCNEMECPIVSQAFEELLEIWPTMWD